MVVSKSFNELHYHKKCQLVGMAHRLVDNGHDYPEIKEIMKIDDEMMDAIKDVIEKSEENRRKGLVV